MSDKRYTTRAERNAILSWHQRSDLRYFYVGDEERSEPREYPVCGRCGEEWGEHGCTLVRLVHDVGAAEGEIREATDRAREAGIERDDAHRAMIKIGSLARWRINPDNRVWEVNFQISAEVLAVRGSAPAIDYCLIEISKQMKAKHKELHRDRDEEMAVAMNTMLWTHAKISDPLSPSSEQPK